MMVEMDVSYYHVWIEKGLKFFEGWWDIEMTYNGEGSDDSRNGCMSFYSIHYTSMMCAVANIERKAMIFVRVYFILVD
jgi:hypothetical protein